MASILTSDVQTYVRELISKEFGSVNNEEKSPSESENRRSFNSEHQKQPQQTAGFGQQIKE